MNKQKVSKETETKPDGYTLLGTVVCFPKNEIEYFQDFRWLKGIPNNVNFLIESDAGHDDFWLVADNYGNLKKPNSYGNGSIAVKISDIEWALSQ